MKTRWQAWTTALVLAVAVGAAQAAWYDADWQYRQKITIDGSQVSGTLTDFPLLLTEVCLQADLWSRAQTNGNDIVFTKSDGVTKLSHELERYSANDQQIVAWVKIPEFSSVTGTEIYMYYGNAAAINQEDATNVWADYRAVWHLGEEVTDEGSVSGAHQDSTANANDGNQSGNNDTAGKIGNGQSFDGNDTVSFTAAGVESLTFTSAPALTVSVWYRPDSGMISDGVQEVVIKIGANHLFALNVLGSNNDTRPSVWGSGGTASTRCGIVAADTWYYDCFTYDGSNIRGYRNGNLFATGVSAGVFNPTTQNGIIGESVEGIVDEVRIAGIVRSADWIKTKYNNQSSPSAFARAWPEPGDTWYNRDWEYRQEITIDSSQVSGNLTNFPVLITGANVDTALWAHAQADGDDIVFTGGDGVTRLSHELELYSSNDQEVVAWAKIPELSSGIGTVLYVYYGNPTAINQEDVLNVWGDYRAIWHLGEDVTDEGSVSAAHRDSTANANDGNQSGNNDTAGKIGNGQSFDGNDTVSFTAAGVESLTFTSAPALTVSVWYRPDSGMISDGVQEVVIKIGANHLFALNVLGSNNDTRPSVWGSGGTASTRCGIVAADTWYYDCFTYDGSNIRGYRNGNLFATGVSAGVFNPTTQNGIIGESVEGIVDEVRISGSVRSADWIKTEHNNQSSPAAFAASSGEHLRSFPGTVIIVQ